MFKNVFGNNLKNFKNKTKKQKKKPSCVSHKPNVHSERVFLLLSHRFLLQDKEDLTPTGKPNGNFMGPQVRNFKCRLSFRAGLIHPEAQSPRFFLYLYCSSAW